MSVFGCCENVRTNYFCRDSNPVQKNAQKKILIFLPNWFLPFCRFVLLLAIPMIFCFVFLSVVSFFTFIFLLPSLLYFCFCKGVRTAVLHQFQLQIKLVISCRVGAMKLSICVLTQFESERKGKPRSAQMLQTSRPRAFVEGYFWVI